MSFKQRILQRLFMWGAMITRGATLGVRAIVVDKSNNIVLVRHTYVPGWYLPGGGVERGESMLTSLKRELLEEANVRLTSEPELIGVYLNMKTSRQDHVALYLCREWEQDAVPKPNMEIAECKIFPLNDLPEEITQSTRARLTEVFEKGSKSEFWS
jgi:ADP-ribose pyrophosphatase YjhB (NUDIX family)